MTNGGQEAGFHPAGFLCQLTILHCLMIEARRIECATKLLDNRSI
jgi:hypothetical protein